MTSRSRTSMQSPCSRRSSSSSRRVFFGLVGATTWCGQDDPPSRARGRARAGRRAGSSRAARRRRVGAVSADRRRAGRTRSRAARGRRAAARRGALRAAARARAGGADALGDVLSPGERKRWQIGGALAREPDVLFLDEPTNHLDASARELLLDALRRYRGVGVVVAHDRAFLDRAHHRDDPDRGGAAPRSPLRVLLATRVAPGSSPRAPSSTSAMPSPPRRGPRSASSPPHGTSMLRPRASSRRAIEFGAA